MTTRSCRSVSSSVLGQKGKLQLSGMIYDRDSRRGLAEPGNPALGRQQSRDSPIDVPATQTIPDAKLRYHDALDWRSSITTARTKEQAASFFCPFAPVKSFLVAQVSIGERRRCGPGDIDRCLPKVGSPGSRVLDRTTEIPKRRKLLLLSRSICASRELPSLVAEVSIGKRRRKWTKVKCSFPFYPLSTTRMELSESCRSAPHRVTDSSLLVDSLSSSVASAGIFRD